LDVLRISGQRKTFVLGEGDVDIKKLASQMKVVVHRPLQKGSAVAELVKEECETFQLMIANDKEMLYIDDNKALLDFVRKQTLIFFAEKPILTTSEIENDARSRIVNEIIETERTYISGLLEMYQYRIGLTRGIKKLEEDKGTTTSKRKTRKIKPDELSFSDVESVFENLEKLIELNGAFYITLKERLRKWSDNQVIGDCFLSLVKKNPGKNDDQSGPKTARGAEYVYAEWGKNYNFALAVYDKMKNNSQMSEALRNLKRTLDLDAILIMPVQRLPRYSLLINDLLKRTTKDHPDYDNLIQAGVEIGNLTFHVDEQIKRMQNSKNEIGKEYPWLQKYLTSERTLQLHLKTTARRRTVGKYHHQIKYPSTDERIVLALFDDLLIISIEDETIEVPINLVWLKEGEKDDQFELIVPLTSFLISCEGPKVKLQWVPYVKRSIFNSLPEEERGEKKKEKEQKKKKEKLPEVRKGSYELSVGGLYSGEWLTGVMSGAGSLIATDGSIYSGAWVSGQKHGKGKLVLVDGTEFESFWLEDENTGYTKMTSSSGKYCGFLLAGLRHGEGRAEYKNGDIYEGAWVNDVPHGKGTLKTSMSTYEGEFNNGIYHGPGTLTTPYSEFSGNFVQGIREGEGRLKEKDFTYEGNFLGNVFHHHGKWEHSDGSSYVGDFEYGLRHGEGTLSVPDHVKYVGSWKKGRQSGKGTLAFSDGTTYVGNFKAGRMHGVGTLKTEDYLMEGQWKNGLRDGIFTVVLYKTNPVINEEKDAKGKSSTKTRAHQDTESMTFKDGVLVHSTFTTVQKILFPPWRYFDTIK